MEQSLIHFGVAAACQFLCSTGCVYAAAAGEAATLASHEPRPQPMVAAAPSTAAAPPQLVAAALLLGRCRRAASSFRMCLRQDGRCFPHP